MTATACSWQMKNLFSLRINPISSPGFPEKSRTVGKTDLYISIVTGA